MRIGRRPRRDGALTRPASGPAKQWEGRRARQGCCVGNGGFEMSVSVLDRIKTPADLKRLSMDELAALAGEMRSRIFQAVSKNGGHLASNLGVVELTIALHYVYDFGPHPKGPDRLLFDVGHQCYPHKMLTGRAGMFETLRKKGSVGGFPVPEESPYDLFAVG